MTYDDLLIEADSYNLITKEKPLKSADGLIKGNKIAIRKGLPITHRKCILAEELGHYHTTVGDILIQSSSNNRKQEQRARLYAYNNLIGLYGIVNCYIHGCQSLSEMAEYLSVTEGFLSEALTCYRQKYGRLKRVDNYIVYFEPNLHVLKVI